jgi:hypothetical protein
MILKKPLKVEGGFSLMAADRRTALSGSRNPLRELHPEPELHDRVIAFMAAAILRD